LVLVNTAFVAWASMSVPPVKDSEMSRPVITVVATFSP
jgi:hypothetical protein